MSTDTKAAPPRKLVVILSGYAGSSHGDKPMGSDMDGYPQLIRILRLPWIDRPSRIDRLVDRLKLTKEKRLPYEDVVEDAYTFISQNYQPGNHVVLIVDVLRPDDQKALSDAAETLARHLYNGTDPRYLQKPQSKDESNPAESSIPVHCVIVDDTNATSGPSEWNDQIKSRLAYNQKRQLSHPASSDSLQESGTLFAAVDPSPVTQFTTVVVRLLQKRCVSTIALLGLSHMLLGKWYIIRSIEPRSGMNKIPFGPKSLPRLSFLAYLIRSWRGLWEFIDTRLASTAIRTDWYGGRPVVFFFFGIN
ncbi:unnamed protein product, partial [Rhizoctonia solani]